MQNISSKGNCRESGNRPTGIWKGLYLKLCLWLESRTSWVSVESPSWARLIIWDTPGQGGHGGRKTEKSWPHWCLCLFNCHMKTGGHRGHGEEPCSVVCEAMLHWDWKLLSSFYVSRILIINQGHFRCCSHPWRYWVLGDLYFMEKKSVYYNECRHHN